MHELDREASYAILDRVKVGHLGVIDGGRPYVTPISFVRDGDTLLMRTAFGRRLEALRTNPAACLEASEVDAETGDWRSVLVFGEVVEARDEVSEANAVQLLLQKYRDVTGPVTSWTVPELLPGAAVVLAMPMDDVSGRSSGGGLSPRTRPGRL